MTARTLTILFALQLFVAAVVWWPADRSASLPHPLLEFDAAQVSAIAIAARPSEGKPVDWLELARGNAGRWQIASEGGYPADEEKVQSLLENLLKMEIRRPIASRQSSHNALKVGDKDWGRRVRLTTEDGERELVIGAAKSNSVNVRIADETDVYLASGLSEWSLHDDARSFWNPVYLDTAATEINAVRLQNATGVLRLARDAAGWHLIEPASDRSVDTEAVDDFIAAVTNVRMDTPVGTQVLDEHGLDGSIRLSWTIAAENESVAGGYVVGAENGANRFLKSDSSAFVVEVAASALARLTDARPDDFLNDEIEIEPLAELE